MRLVEQQLSHLLPRTGFLPRRINREANCLQLLHSTSDSSLTPWERRIWEFLILSQHDNCHEFFLVIHHIFSFLAWPVSVNWGICFYGDHQPEENMPYQGLSNLFLLLFLIQQTFLELFLCIVWNAGDTGVKADSSSQVSKKPWQLQVESIPHNEETT